MFTRSSTSKGSSSTGRLRRIRAAIYSNAFSRFSLTIKKTASTHPSIYQKQAERVFALTDAPMPVEFDSETLETVGVADWDQDLGHTSSAHPHYDDYMFNYVTEFSRNSTYKIYRMPEDDRQREVFSEIDTKLPSYVHSFGLTENHVVFVEFPYVIDPKELLLHNRPFARNLEWRPDIGTRFFLVDRESGDVKREMETEPFFAYHHINAWEDGDEVVVDLTRYDGPQAINAYYLDEIESEEFCVSGGIPHRYRLGVEDVEKERLTDVPLELPRINYDYNTRDYRYVYGVGHQENPYREFPNRLLKLDVKEKETVVWEDENSYPSEPVFVESPAEDEEDEGVVLSVVIDLEQEKSFLVVLDAEEFTELGRATVDHGIPYPLHGQFYDGL